MNPVACMSKAAPAGDDSLKENSIGGNAMMVKRLVFVVCAATAFSIGATNADPCNKTTGTGGGQQASSSAAQTDQRQEHAQPSVAEQPKSTGKAAPSNTGEQPTEPSAKMTDQDRFSGTGTHTEGAETSSKMADQGC
jgi:hypothetical protein